MLNEATGFPESIIQVNWYALGKFGDKYTHYPICTSNRVITDVESTSCDMTLQNTKNKHRRYAAVQLHLKYAIHK